MSVQTIGVLHPGEMGVSIAASAQKAGHELLWASQGRSQETCTRAKTHGLKDMHTIDALCAASNIVISVCTPHAAEDVANAVIACGFSGLYLDANAISPQRAIRISQAMAQAGIDYVDGGIIGPPAWKPSSTWLHLSGSRAAEIAQCFSAGPLITQILSNAPGDASALKMCFAAYTKGSTALLCAILAASERLNVREALFNQWDQGDAGFRKQTIQRVRGVTAKAWRFEGEMREIADTFQGAGLPGGFHQAAASVYQQLARFQGQTELPELETVLNALLDFQE